MCALFNLVAFHVLFLVSPELADFTLIATQIKLLYWIVSFLGFTLKIFLNFLVFFSVWI